MRGLTLLLPDKPDPERDAVADAWVAAGGKAERIGRFWEPPAYDAQTVRLYGNDTFCLVLAQKLGLELVSPPVDLLLLLPEVFVKLPNCLRLPSIVSWRTCLRSAKVWGGRHGFFDIRDRRI